MVQKKKGKKEWKDWNKWGQKDGKNDKSKERGMREVREGNKMGKWEEGRKEIKKKENANKSWEIYMKLLKGKILHRFLNPLNINARGLEEKTDIKGRQLPVLCII